MNTPGLQEKGFFPSLFDVGFTTFVTLRFLKVIYIVLMALIGLGAVVFLLRGLSQGGGAAVASLVLVPLVALVYLVFVRIYLELLAVLFRIGENTSRIAAQLAGGAGPASGYGQPPACLPPFGTPGAPGGSGGPGYGGSGYGPERGGPSQPYGPPA